METKNVTASVDVFGQVQIHLSDGGSFGRMSQKTAIRMLQDCRMNLTEVRPTRLTETDGGRSVRAAGRFVRKVSRLNVARPALLPCMDKELPTLTERARAAAH